jgi:hypothetical protein
MGDDAFDRAWRDGAVLTPGDAVNYALRGRGERGRPGLRRAAVIWQPDRNRGGLSSF